MNELERLVARVPSATLMPVNGRVPCQSGWVDWPAGTRTVSPGMDVGLITGRVSGVFVIDCDSAEAAEAFVTKYGDPQTFTVQTKRGVHFYFAQPDFDVRNSVSKIMNKVDVRGERGFVLAPGSKDKVIAIDDTVASAPPDLLRDLQATATPTSDIAAPIPIDVGTPEGQRRTMMGVAHCLSAPPAIEGQNGSAALFAVAMYLVRSLELPIPQAHAIIDEHYNPRCDPPWDGNDILHKLTDAANASDRPTGVPPDGFMDKFANHQPLRPAAQPMAASGKLNTIPFTQIVQTLTTHPDWKDVLRFNVLSRKPMAIKPPINLALTQGAMSDGDVGAIRCWFEMEGAKVTSESVLMAVHTVCECQPYNPFVEYLDSLPPSTGHLSQIAEEVLNSPDGAIASRILTKQIVAAVRRMRAQCGPHEKSTRVDHRVVVIFDGEQLTGKSSFLRQMSGDEYYASMQGDVHDKDTKIMVAGKVFVEMEEMAVARRADRDALKAFISAAEDEYRKPYGRSSEKVVRSFVLFGTSNDLRLSDPTGNTRYAVIHVGKMCGRDYLLSIRDALWSEANALALDETFDHHLDEEEKAFCGDRNEDYTADIFTDNLREALAGVSFVTVTEAYNITMQSEKKVMPTPAEQGQVLDALRRCGCKYIKIKHKRGWLVPADIAALPKKQSIMAWLRQDAQATAVREHLSQKSN